jgi:hypothetical protein
LREQQPRQRERTARNSLAILSLAGRSKRSSELKSLSCSTHTSPNGTMVMQRLDPVRGGMCVAIDDHPKPHSFRSEIGEASAKTCSTLPAAPPLLPCGKAPPYRKLLKVPRLRRSPLKYSSARLCVTLASFGAAAYAPYNICLTMVTLWSRIRPIITKM